jgi:hypothetical protein
MTKKLVTNRLFFGRWPFKVETQIKGAGLIKRWGVIKTQQWCDRLIGYQWDEYPYYKTIDRDELKDYAGCMAEFLGDRVQLRVEHHTMNYYTDDYAIYQGLQQKLQPWLSAVSEPRADDLEFLTNNTGRKVLCNELPHGKFQYKIYLSTSMPPPLRMNFVKWLSNYSGKVKTSDGSVGWMLGHNPYFQDPFVYVEDQKTLFMIGLFLSSYAKKTQEFVLRNTVK